MKGRTTGWLQTPSSVTSGVLGPTMCVGSHPARGRPLVSTFPSPCMSILDMTSQIFHPDFQRTATDVVSAQLGRVQELQPLHLAAVRDQRLGRGLRGRRRRRRGFNRAAAADATNGECQQQRLDGPVFFHPGAHQLGGQERGRRGRHRQRNGSHISE